MTINEITTKISAEKQIPGRFPSRLIFVSNFDDYTTLITDLKAICDVTLDLASFTKGDILPRFKDLKAELNKYSGKQVLMLSFGEYLRICAKRERDKATSAFSGIWEQQQAESSTTKYIIPIFGDRAIFDQIVTRPDERQQRFVWEVTSYAIESEYCLTIYSPEFSSAIKTDAANLQEWLENWDLLYGSKSRRSFSLSTKLYRYADTVFGGLTINVVDEPFAYAVSRLADGERLKKGYLNDQYWMNLATNIKHGEPLSATIKHILNFGHSFDPVSVLARFADLSDFEKKIFWLWYKLYPSDDYFTYAISKASSVSDIPTTLRDAIFQLSEPSEVFIKQRIAALRVMDVSYNDDYFSALDKIPSPEMRLRFLTFKTLSERSYAIKTVSNLLRIGADVDAVTRLINCYYPDLAVYLMPSNNINAEVAQYFNWYRRCKLINRPNTDIPCNIDFDCIDSRNKVLQQFGTDDTISFWVDGLGAEWLPLLMYKLKTLNIETTVSAKVAKSLLPSETEYNRRWADGDEKWDRLDKISHTGMPDDKDYFLCIARQIEIISEVVEHIAALLSKANRVILTGDHGSSRLAALLFHAKENFAIDPPKNSVVRSFGRFVELKDDSYVSILPSMERVVLNGRSYIVMKTYEHFKQSGNVAGGNTDENAIAGEVHGGMTPEEHLVPVIVVSRKTPLPKQPTIIKSKGISNNEMRLP